jgi:flagellar biosynthesis GTPase FlhF
MSNTIRTFRAATTDEALAQVRREMGLDAVIVEVKQVAKTGLFSWLSAKWK